MEYQEFLKKNKDDMIFALQKVVRCSSEEGEPFVAPDGQTYPFGQGVQDALETVLEMGREMGFAVKNVDNYGGHIDFPGSGDKIMGILGHLDVVPAGDGWQHEPYGGEIEEGRLYGRGTSDDKGPVIACLFAMKALKEAGYQPKATIRLILGLDEETHWKGMEYYFARERKPDWGFTPDADFPLINGEKGMLVFDLAKKFARTSGEGLVLRSLSGGIAPNSVPDSCRAVLNASGPQQGEIYEEIRAKAAAYKEESGHALKIRGMGKSLELISAGKASHGAKPEDGLNAISVMMDFLGRLSFVNEDVNDFISFYNRHLGFCLNGEAAGIGFCDEKSGRLVLNVGMAEIGPEAGKLVINIRYPVSNVAEDIYAGLKPVLDRYEIGLIKREEKPTVYIDVNDPLVQTLLSIYREHSGDYESQPQVIGGGTYAKAAPHIIAYGGMFPGDEDRMHQRDEYIDLKRYEQMAAIYADAIYKLSAEEYEV